MQLSIAARSIRARLSAWIGAFIMLVAASALVAVVSSQLETAVSLPGDAGDAVRGYSLPMGLLALTVAAVVLPTVLARTVSVQTRDYALLRLAGAAPRQVRRILSAQLILVAVTALPVGVLLGIPAAELFFRYTADQSAALRTKELVFGPGTVVSTVLVVTVFALLAGLGAARRAARAPILLAVTDRAPSELPGRFRRVGRVVVAVLSGALGIALFWLSLQVQSPTISTTVLNVLGLGALILFCATATVAAFASVLLPRLTRFWTRPLITRSVGWLLAARSVQSQLSKTSSGVLPLYVSLTLVAGIFSLLWTADAAFVAAGRIAEGQSATNVGGVLLILSGGLFLAGTGAAVAILIANRERRHEYSIRRVLGESDASVVGSSVLESIIFMISSLLLSALVVVPVVALTALSMSRHVGSMNPRFELGMPLVIAVIGFTLIALVLMPPAIRATRDTSLAAAASDE